MTKIQSFKELIVWQKSMDLVEAIYVATARLPQSEQYGLMSQMRRCAVSIPSNIAEGKKRGTRKDFTQFLRIADGSGAELETQILIMKKLFHSIDLTRASSLLEEVQKMLSVIIRKMDMPLQAKSFKL
jgi:four helix bundle protein